MLHNSVVIFYCFNSPFKVIVLGLMLQPCIKKMSLWSTPLLCVVMATMGTYSKTVNHFVGWDPKDILIVVSLIIFLHFILFICIIKIILYLAIFPILTYFSSFIFFIISKVYWSWLIILSTCDILTLYSVLKTSNCMFNVIEDQTWISQS